MGERVRCCSCGRFVRLDNVSEHVEYGDYGTVHSVEYECCVCAASDPGALAGIVALSDQRASTERPGEGER